MIASYIRVSTLEQALHGISIEAQEAAVRAAVPGVETEVFVDSGVSASKRLDARPEGKRLLAGIADGSITTVVTTKLDRLFRSTLEALQVIPQWSKRGVSIIILNMGGGRLDTDSPFGKCFLTIMAALAELERDQCSVRTREAMRYMAANHPDGWISKKTGKHVSGFGSGYDRETVDLVHEFRKEGYTYPAIAQMLNKMKLKPKRGAKKWTTAMVTMLEHRRAKKGWEDGEDA